MADGLSSAISLRPVDQSNYEECIALSVGPGQEGFVAPNVKSLADAYIWRDAEPFAVYADDGVVGFALLYPLPDRGFILVRLMIDGRFQGLGYGRSALAAVVEMVRERGAGTLRLSVLPENTQAIEFYRRNGFAETGELEGPEIVMELDL